MRVAEGTRARDAEGLARLENGKLAKCIHTLIYLDIFMFDYILNLHLRSVRDFAKTFCNSEIHTIK